VPGHLAEAFVTPTAGVPEPAAIRPLPARGDVSIAS
jgi:hypothetical protein